MSLPPSFDFPHSHPLFWRCPLIRGSLPSCLLYQRDLHLKKPTVPPLCSMLAYSSTNRPWPTCSFSSRLPSYHQVRSQSSLIHICGCDACGCQITYISHCLIMFLHQLRMAVCGFFFGDMKKEKKKKTCMYFTVHTAAWMKVGWQK